MSNLPEQSNANATSTIVNEGNRDVGDDMTAASNNEPTTAEMDGVQQLIEGVLKETQERFKAMSDQIIRRIDDMANRVDTLERNITDLMAEAGVQPEN